MTRNQRRKACKVKALAKAVRIANARGAKAAQKRACIIRDNLVKARLGTLKDASAGLYKSSCAVVMGG